MKKPEEWAVTLRGIRATQSYKNPDLRYENTPEIFRLIEAIQTDARADYPAKLARQMGLPGEDPEKEVSHAIQRHAPWNGRSCCDIKEPLEVTIKRVVDAALAETYTPKGIEQWWARPRPQLGDRSPKLAWEHGGYGEVLTLALGMDRYT